MPSYVYTGGVPRMLFGLSHGVNARGSDRLKPGQTVVVDPGDTVWTEEPYDHAHLEEIEKSEPPTPAPRRRTNKKEGVTER